MLERRQSIPRVESTSAKRSFLVGVSRPAHPEVTVKRAQPSAAEYAADPVHAGRVRRRTSTRGRKLRLIGGLALFTAGIVLAVTGVLAWWAAAIGAVALLGSIGSVRASMALERRRRRAEQAGATSGRGRARSGSRRAGSIRGRSRRSRRPSRESARPALTHGSPAFARGGETTGVPARPRGARVVTAAAADAARSATRRPAIRRVTNAPVASSRVRGSSPLYVPSAAAATAATGNSDRSRSGASAARTSTPLYDVDEVAARYAAAEAAASSGAGTARDVDDTLGSVEATPAAAGTWQPVDVPPPTYTMKAKAPQSPRSGQSSDRPATRVERRHAGAASPAIADLPFDGNALALDEEFEDLPAVRTG